MSNKRSQCDVSAGDLLSAVCACGHQVGIAHFRNAAGEILCIMCSAVDPRNLMGIAEVADYFSVNPSTASNWAAHRQQNGMPEPLRSLRCGTIYDISELIPWWCQWKPVKGAKAGKLPEGAGRDGELG